MKVKTKHENKKISNHVEVFLKLLFHKICIRVGLVKYNKICIWEISGYLSWTRTSFLPHSLLFWRVIGIVKLPLFFVFNPNGFQHPLQEIRGLLTKKIRRKCGFTGRLYLPKNHSQVTVACGKSAGKHKNFAGNWFTNPPVISRNYRRNIRR